MRSHPLLGPSRRGAVALAVVAVAFVGCTTTTRLGPAGEPATARTIEDLATQPNAYARGGQPPPAVQPIYAVDGPSPIVGHEPGWLTVSKGGAPIRVPLSQIRSVSTYGHARGALDGAVAVGAVGFILGFAAGALVISQSCNVDGSCDTSIPVGTRLVRGTRGGAIAGAFGAVLGAAMGAILGHEMRYEIAAPDAPD